jgi:flagellar export protein FliJ
MARSSFKFRMQRLLDVRVMREKLAQSELLALRQKAELEHQKLAMMQAEEQQLRAAQARPLERGEDLREWAAKRVWLEKEIVAKQQEQVQQQSAIKRAEQAVAAQQEVVKQCGIDVKALEKVRENQREVHRVDQLREEGLFMDDLAGQGFLRRRTKDAQIAAEEAERHNSEGAPS